MTSVMFDVPPPGFVGPVQSNGAPVAKVQPPASKLTLGSGPMSVHGPASTPAAASSDYDGGGSAPAQSD